MVRISSIVGRKAQVLAFLTRHGIQHVLSCEQPIEGKEAPKKNSGKPSSTLREAIIKLCDVLKKEGNTIPLGKGKVSVFIEEMKKRRKEDNSDIGKYLQVRISDIKKSEGVYKITTQEKPLKRTKSRKYNEQSITYKTHDVSTILSDLRKKNLLT